MAIDNELIDDKRLPVDPTFGAPAPALGSAKSTDIQELSGGPIFAPVSSRGLSLAEISGLAQTPNPTGFSGAFQTIPQSELIENQRYPVYGRNEGDLEDINAQNQSWYGNLARGVAKLGARAVGTFAQSLTNIPNTISAIKNRSISKLSGDPNGYEGTVDNWMNNIENLIPTYQSKYAKDHPYLSAIPFFKGSSYFWGQQFLPNIGFMVGAVAGAAVQDIAIGAVTEGIGEIPLVANQIGKASLYLNKLLTGTNDVEKLNEIATGLGKTEQQVLNVQKLAELSAAARINNGFRYGMSIYGSALTEAGMEARDGYNQVKTELTKQYKLANGGVDPDFQSAQEIEDYATNAMNVRFGVNMAILTASEALMMGNLYKSMISGGKGPVTGALQRELEGLGKVGLKEGTIDEFEKVSSKSVAGKVWDKIKPYAGTMFAEGVYEEGGQYAAERGTYDYYTRKYQSKKNKESFDDLNETIKSTVYGMKEQFGSPEGIENMLVGALTGLVMGVGEHLIDVRKGEDTNTKLNQAIAILNSHGLTNTLKGMYDSTINAAGIAKDMEEANASGDIYKYKNLQEDQFFNYVYSRIPSGMHDVTIEQLQMLKGLPKDEFEKLFQLDWNSTNKATVSEYVDNLINKADQIKATSDLVDRNFINPFVNKPNFENPASLIEAANYNTFENYKTDLVRYATTSSEVNNRLESIQHSVSEIHPLVTNTALEQLTSKDGLTELRNFYENKAKTLNETVSSLETAAERKSTKDQIKALRTSAEQIANILNTGKIDDKIFEKLLNFELKGQDPTKDDVIPLGSGPQLRQYGIDINRLNEKKVLASKAYDELTSEEGFTKYFDQADKMAQDKKDIIDEEKPDLEKETITPPSEAEPTYEFTNKGGEKEAIEENREYEIPQSRQASVSKIDDDRWQVTTPNGSLSFYKTKEAADEAAGEINSDYADLAKVKVIAKNPDGTVKVEDVNGDIQNINPEQLAGYEKIQTDQEKLQKFANDINKEQAEIELNSGPVATVNSSVTINPFEGKLKDASILFESTTSETEEDNFVPKPHQARAIEFLNNVGGFENRPRIKAILVTPNQEDALGLTGLTEAQFGKPKAEVENLTNVDKGFVAAVYVEQDGNNVYFVDKEGKRVAKVGEKMDMNKVVFNTMPTTDLRYKDQNRKYRAEQEQEAIAKQAGWKVKRAELFDASGYKVYDFTVSNGIPVTVENQRNSIGETLVPKNVISTQEGLVKISTTGFVFHKGKQVKVPIGYPLIQYNDTLQTVRGRTFTPKESQGVFEVLKKISSEVNDQLAAGKPIRLNRLYTTYLQNILYWKSKGASGANQILINTNTMNLELGKEKYDLTKIADSEKAIVDQLKGIYQNINNDTLSKKFHDKFLEPHIGPDGNLITSEWTNYQTYLLSDTYPNGSKRAISETPLSTNVAKKSDILPYNFKQKYAVIEGMELPEQVVVAPKAETIAKQTPEGYKFDGTTENVYDLSSGPVVFTATRDASGNTYIKINDNDTVTGIAKDEGKVKQIVEALKNVDAFDASKSDLDIVKDYLKLQIVKGMQTEETVPAPEAPLELIKTVNNAIANVTGSKVKPIDYSTNQPGKIRNGEYIPDNLGGQFGRWVAESLGEYLKEGKIDKVEAEKLFKQYAKEVHPDKYQSVESQLVADAFFKAMNVAKNEGRIKVLNDLKKEFDSIISSVGDKADIKTDFTKSKPPKDSEYRMLGREDVDRISDAELDLFKEWHAKNVPNIPFQVLDNIITAHNGEKAWGVFEDGVAKFYKGGQRGTEYHEIFEGIFKGFLSPEEQQALLDEFKAKPGKFKDRESGKMLFYEEATNKQAKERIADDFADFRLGKLPARNIGERILNFFKDIINFVKQFVNKPSRKEELFKAIDTGRFKEAELSKAISNDFTEYRMAEGLNEKQTHEVVQDILARFFRNVFGTNGSLYDIADLTSPEIFNAIKAEYEEEDKVVGDKTWNDLVNITKQKLRTFKIEFDNNNELNINGENVSNRSYSPEAFTTDWKKNSSFAVKILTGTLVETVPTNQQNSSTLSLPKTSVTKEGFLKLLNFSRSFATVIDKLANTTSVTKMVDKLTDLAKADSNYVRLFTRLKGDREGMFVDFSKFEPHDWRLFVQFYQTFTKQRPDALIQYVSGDDVYTAPASLFTVTRQTKNDWVNNLKALSTDMSSLVRYDKTNKVYKAVSAADVPITTPQQMSSFLNRIGVTFGLDAYLKLKPEEKTKFADAVASIHKYFGQTKELASVTGKTLGINGPLDTLSALYVKVENPIQDSTFSNIDENRRQSFSDNNTPSLFENEFNESGDIEELKSSRPELNDVFSTNSTIWKRMFNEAGKRIKSIKIAYIDGTKNENNNLSTSTSDLTLGNRFTQELNQNFNGNYNIIIPADSSTEWMINLGNYISYADMSSGEGWNKIYSTFEGYLKDEIALAQSNRSYLDNTKPRAKELRFFKDILTGKTLSGINNLIINDATEEQIKEYIDKNIADINKDVKTFIENNAEATKNVLKDNNKIVDNPNGTFKYESLDGKFAVDASINKKSLSEDEVDSLMKFARVNYIINNIEMHKILFGDPYQFAIKNVNLDETKRIKSFLSPRRTIFDTPEFNSFHNQQYNKAGDIELKQGDPGYHEFKSYIDTVTLRDITVVGDINEADAASFIMDNTWREVKMRNGQWDYKDAEDWHQWQMAYTRQALDKKGDWSYGDNDKLRAHDEALVNTPEPEYVTDVLKPIVSGNKYGKNKFDLVLDKFSQMPLYYKAIEGTNLGDFYIKMWKEGMGYAVFESGRKVGVEGLHDVYNKEGGLNTEPFNNRVPVAWKTYGIQVENSYEGDKTQTRGSQATKISSIDLFNNGVAKSEEAAEQYKRHNDALDGLHKEAYTQLLNRMGIEDLGDGFNIVDKTALSKSLEYEMLRRELSDNVIDTIQTNENGQFRFPFEASPAYEQIRSILYSMVNNSLISPKMNGIPAVQAPVTLWEKSGTKRGVTTVNGKQVFTDSALKSYTKDHPYMEILVPHQFKDQFKKAGFKSDEELLAYLNKPENESILKGIGFRIPTQALSSMMIFKIKGFLPQFMGATVVVPSEITKIAGSDFDIDKLNMYLKNTYVNSKGELKLVPFFGYGEEAKEAIKKFILKEDLESIFDINDRTVAGTEDDYGKLADRLYKQSLENEYFDSVEKLLTLPENYDRLVNPVSDGGLEDVSKQLDKLMGIDETKVKNRLLDGNYLTALRHAFIIAKKWVGIGAVNITNHSLAQKVQTYLDPVKLASLSAYEKKILGNGQIALPHNKMTVDGKERISLSGIKDKANKYISDNLSGFITSFADVAKNPYILKIINSNLAVNTFMFLTRIGTPLKTSALFMNQPIIKEYLKYLDSIDSKSIYSKKNLDYIRGMFPADVKKVGAAKIELKNLATNIQTYYSEKKTIDNVEQQKILAEFLKYHKMAQYLFKLTQATNYDTTRFKSAEAMGKKRLRTDVAEESNIFTSAKDILDNSHIGNQAYFTEKSMNSLGEVLKLDQLDYTVITGKVLDKYTQNEYLSADAFDRIAVKIKSSFIDYITQIKTGLNDRLIDLLVNPETSIASQLAKAKKDHPEMEILQYFTEASSDRTGGAKSIQLKASSTDAYDLNLYTGMMRELRDNPKTNALYNSIVNVAILQGVYQSPISIKNIIPVEDYAKKVKPAIDSITSDLNAANFTKGAFERNNWRDKDVFKTITNIIPAFYNEGFNEKGETVYNIQFNQFPTLDGLSETGVKNILLLDRFENFADVGSDFILIPRVVTYGKEKIDTIDNKPVTRADYARKKAAGDTSLRDVIGFQKVKYENGQPLMKGNSYVYKAINLWGDGQYAVEMYNDSRKSVFNNGTIKIDNEIPDANIIAYFTGINKEVVPSLNGTTVKVISDSDISAFNSYLEKSEGKYPKEFFTANTKFKEFYNPQTGKREGAPQDSVWMLIDNKLYDLVSKESGEVYISNVDLATGKKSIAPEGLPPIKDNNQNNCG